MFIVKHHSAIAGALFCLIASFLTTGRAKPRPAAKERSQFLQGRNLPSPPPGVYRVSDAEQFSLVVQRWQVPGGPCAENEWGLSVPSGRSLAKALRPGIIVVSTPRPDAPDGFLRRVVRETSLADRTIFCTTEANLEDTHVSGGNEATLVLSLANVVSARALVHGVTIHPPFGSPARLLRTAGVGDPPLDPSACVGASRGFELEMRRARLRGTAEVTGGIDVCPRIDMVLTYQSGHLQYLKFDLRLDELAKVDFTAQATGLWSKHQNLADIRFEPILFDIGGVPVVVRPVVTIFFAGTGSFNGEVREVAYQQASRIALMQYTRSGGWRSSGSEIAAAAPRFGHPTIVLGSHAKGALGVRVELELYGILGPYFQPDGYVEANYGSQTGCSMQAGLEGSAGIELKIFWHTVAREDFDHLFDFKKTGRCR